VEPGVNHPLGQRGPGPGKGFAVVAAALAIGLGLGAVIAICLVGGPTRSGAPSSSDLPAGGISREGAIHSACARSALCAGDHIDASASYDSEYGTWTWHVYGSSEAAGPTSGMDCAAVVDYLTGEVLHSECHFL
jgi:hypothetical protein